MKLDISAADWTEAQMTRQTYGGWQTSAERENRQNTPKNPNKKSFKKS